MDSLVIIGISLVPPEEVPQGVDCVVDSPAKIPSHWLEKLTYCYRFQKWEIFKLYFFIGHP